MSDDDDTTTVHPNAQLTPHGHREMQSQFVWLVADFLHHVKVNMPNHEFTFGECYRTPEQAVFNAEHGSGISHSLHTERLAIDLQLFIGGIYQEDTDAYRELGEYWKSLDPQCRWGGDIAQRPDGNHFSFSPDQRI